MAVPATLDARTYFLLTTPDDTEDAPWMVMADLQVRDVDLLKSILRVHIARERLPWYLASYLKVTMPRPDGRPLDAAPDLLVALAPERLRTSWNIREEGKAPEFVLEVVSERSQERDTEEKPAIYDAMGVAEYVIFAPERKDGGPVLSGYRRDATGAFIAWFVDGDGVLRCQTLGLGLFVVERLWLRAVDQQGQRLPTEEELLRAELAHRQREATARQREAAAREAAERRAATEAAAREAAATAQEAAERAQAQEAARREAAEAEVARLQEELRRLREGRQ